MLSKEFEKKQHKINAYVMPHCLKGLRKIADENSNWSIYHNITYNYMVAIAKPGSGAKDSVYGNIAYIYKQVQTGIIKPSALTKYARRLLHEKGYTRGI